MSEGWTWRLASKAEPDLEALDVADQQRTLEALDEIVDSPWRDPPEYGEPLQNSPYRKIRSGRSGSRSRSAATTRSFLSPASKVAAARTRPTTERPAAALGGGRERDHKRDVLDQVNSDTTASPERRYGILLPTTTAASNNI
jgi:hypothetical protein